MFLSGKVAVTGLGLVTPLGRNVVETWRGVLAGGCGISRHDERAGAPESLKYFGRVNGIERLENIPSNLAGQARFLTRGSIVGFEAAREAVLHSGLDLSSVARERRGCFVASGDLTVIGYEFMHPAIREAMKEGAGQVDLTALNKAMLHRAYPFFLLESIYNNLFSFLSAAFEFMGPNTTLASFSPCGTNALELACRAIQAGDVDAALAVGCGNWINEVPMVEMDGLGLLSRCGHGANSFKPLDRERDGFIPSEGGAAVLVEDAERAEKRGATIFALINGFGNRAVFPSGGGSSIPGLIAEESIQSALEEGSFNAGDLAFICAHGSGTIEGDRSELRSIAEVLGRSRGAVPVCALKPYTGHMGAASDICDLILAIRALSEGIVPGTPNFSHAEPEFQDLEISASIQQARGRSFISISYGMIGQSTSVLVEAV